MTGAVRAVADRFIGRRQLPPETPHARPALAITRWDNVGLAVEKSMQVFVPAASSVPGVIRVDAKSSGPSVHFLVTADRAWDEVIDCIEAKLFAFAHAGELPPLEYDVRTASADSTIPEPGYLRVYPED
jgi:hypothetical protein